jgi:hypothetical protein
VTGYLWDPAGSDAPLAAARTDLRLGRWNSALSVLAESRGDTWLRAHRSLVLGSAAADGDAAEQALQELPGDPDALLLAARVAAIRALRADAIGSAGTQPLGRLAAQACLTAARAATQDPTPLVVLLALAPLGYRQSIDPYGLNVPGPWDLWVRIAALDPSHREGHRRLLDAVVLLAERDGSDGVEAMWRVANWAAAAVPADADPQLLYLVALVEQYRRQRDPDLWSQPGVLIHCAGLFDSWFRRAGGLRPPRLPVADLMLLAHALVMAGPKLELEAGRVLRTALPYAHRYPWELFGDPTAQLDSACRRVGVQPP